MNFELIKIKNMLKDDIKQLMAYTDKPCLTIIIPVSHGFDTDKYNDNMLKKAIAEGREMILGKFGSKDATALLAYLEDMEGYSISQDFSGLGVFISNDFIEIIELPVTPIYTVDAGNEFDLRELIYELDRVEHYFALVLDADLIRLFNGTGNILKEIKDSHFPKKYTDEFEHEHGHRQETGIITGPEKSIIVENRMRSFFKITDRDLGQYLQNNNYTIFVLGADKTEGYFMGESHHKARMAAVIHGSYGNFTLPELAKIVYPKVQEYSMKDQQKTLDQIEDSINKNLFTSNLTNVWNAVAEGNCRVLLVEKGFRQKAHISRDNVTISEDDDNTCEIEVDDAVDVLIRQALKKNSEIIFLDNGKLAEFGQVGLIKRY